MIGRDEVQSNQLIQNITAEKNAMLLSEFQLRSMRLGSRSISSNKFDINLSIPSIKLNQVQGLQQIDE